MNKPLDRGFRDYVEDLKAQVDIKEVIGRHLKLNASNMAKCPFHDDKKPSLHVNVAEQYFHCFACGAGGDVFRFLELHERKLFKEVLAELASEVGMPPPGLEDVECTEIEERRKIDDVRVESARFYQSRITQTVTDYLINERGLNPKTVERHLVGYANGGLKKHLEERGFHPDICVKAGVLRKCDDGSIRDYFRNHIVLPTLKRGRVVYMTGRSWDGTEPRYLNLPAEKQCLYNEDVLGHEEVLVTEGILDCLSAEQAGFHAVAVFGVSGFKEDDAAKFRRCGRVYMAFDADDAGRQGALEIAQMLRKTVKRVMIIQLPGGPDGKDLNDYLRVHSSDDLRALVDTSLDIIDYMISLIPPDGDKRELPDKLSPILRMLAEVDEIEAEVHLRSIKERTGLTLDTLRRKAKGHRRDALKSVGTPKSTPQPQPDYGAYFDGLVDLVDQDGEPAFLVFEDEQLVVLSQLERDGKLIVPPPKDQIPWMLPRAAEVLKHNHDSDEALFDDLVAYHKSISELPSEEHYYLLAAWDIHTYLLEEAQYSPMIWLFAVPEQGKSRTGKGMIYVAYRGVRVESLREAYILRLAHNFGCSLLFDVLDLWSKAEKHGSEDILLNRFERGMTVPRVLYPDRGDFADTVYYTVFGPTIIGTNREVHQTLESRAIQVNMPQSARRFELNVTREASLPFKERLVAFRARHLHTNLPDVLKPAPGRLGDIVKPLLQVVLLAKPDIEEVFLGFVRDLERERKSEKAETFDGRILKAIVECRELAVNDVLAVKEIADNLSEGMTDEKYQVTPDRVGKRLTAMGFQRARTSNGARAIIWDKDALRRMTKKYGIGEVSEVPEVSDVRLHNGTLPDTSDTSDGLAESVEGVAR